MKTPADIITRLQLMSQDGTKSDRRLAGLVLSDLDFASKAAISEIAARRRQRTDGNPFLPQSRLRGLA